MGLYRGALGGSGGGCRRVFGVDFEVMVEDDEEHGAGAKEHGKLIELFV